MRIDELYSILTTKKPSDELKARENELFVLIPELEKCKGFEQNNEWHIYDVYEHTMQVVDKVSNNLPLRLAALFHDVGKPSTYKEDENGVGHFYGHWEVSKNIFSSFSKKHNIDNNMSNLVSNLIYFHDLNLDTLNDQSRLLLVDILGLDGIKMLFELKKADLLSQNSKYHNLLKKYNTQKNKIIKKYTLKNNS